MVLCVVRRPHAPTGQPGQPDPNPGDLGEEGTEVELLEHADEHQCRCDDIAYRVGEPIAIESTELNESEGRGVEEEARHSRHHQYVHRTHESQRTERFENPNRGHPGSS